MTNASGIRPVGHRVLVLPEDVEEVTAGGIVLARELVQKEAMAQVAGVVVEVGVDCWADQPSKWVGPGDRVIFAKYSGLYHKGADGKTYRVINDLDVVAVFDARPS